MRRSTHTAGALHETFPAPEAHRILQRLEFHYTPKHASWLNMVEIEIGVLRGQCLDRRIGERNILVADIEAWQRQRNASGVRISTRSRSYCGIQPLQFYAGIGGGEVPIGFDMFLVSAVLPGGDLLDRVSLSGIRRSRH